MYDFRLDKQPRFLPIIITMTVVATRLIQNDGKHKNSMEAE